MGNGFLSRLTLAKREFRGYRQRRKAPPTGENPDAEPKKLPIPEKYTSENSGVTYRVTGDDNQTKNFELTN